MKRLLYTTLLLVAVTIACFFIATSSDNRNLTSARKTIIYKYQVDSLQCKSREIEKAEGLKIENPETEQVEATVIYTNLIIARYYLYKIFMKP